MLSQRDDFFLKKNAFPPLHSSGLKLSSPLSTPLTSLHTLHTLPSLVRHSLFFPGHSDDLQRREGAGPVIKAQGDEAATLNSNMNEIKSDLLGDDCREH